MPRHLRSFSSYIPKCLQQADQNWDPCITVLPVAQGCCALTRHLDILPSFKFYYCKRALHVWCVFWSPLISPIHEHKLPRQTWAALVYGWERNLTFRKPRTAEEHSWASKIIVLGEILICIYSSMYWLARACYLRLKMKTGSTCV